MAPVVRRLGPSDVDIFRSLRLEALAAELLAYASTVADWERLAVDEWRRRLENPVVAVFRDGEAVAMMGLVRQSSSRMAHRATLVMAYVRKSKRGQGYAGMLLGAVEGEARAIGVEQLELAASADNAAAVVFYRRMGFTEMGRVPGGFRRPDGDADEILMVKRIGGAGNAAPRDESS
ncbi:MAG: GNAT family N-acetyltransferase [Rhizobiales bacterium]|nr:GNAT family N-acetyltransferase [Hyphomicrobiales bacterium]